MNTGKYYFILTIAVFVVGVAFLFQGGQQAYETVIYPPFAAAATSSAVTVSASVTATISCSTSATSTAFGTLSDASVSTASPNTSSSISCTNSSAGCALYIKDSGSGSNPGLWNSTSSALIESPNAAFSTTSTLVAGTEGYGVNATTTSTGAGATVTLGTRYNQSGDTVGGLSLTNQTLASSNATTSNREVVVAHKVAISSATPAGTYSDTITYECTAN